MASQTEIETRKAILRARGVPEAFIDDLANRKGESINTILPPMLVLTIFLTIVILPLYKLNSLTSAILSYLYANNLKSLLFYPSPIVFLGGFILAIYPAFIIAPIIITVFGKRLTHVKPFPHYSAQASYLRKLAQNEVLARILPNIRYGELAHLENDTAFLKAIRASNSSTKMIPALLLAICFPLVIFSASLLFDVPKYKSVTLDTIEIHSGPKTTTYRLANAKYAYVVCSDDPHAVQFHYRIVYADTTTDLWQTHDLLHGLGPEGVLDRLTLIDQKLTQLGIPVHRMPLTGSPHFDGTGCVNHAAKLWGLKNPDKLNRLVFGP